MDPRSPALPQAAPGGGPDKSSVLLVLAGPAGSGKTTLCDRMVAEVPGFCRVITATTRPPRPGEIDGVHYHFLAPEDFESRVAAGLFLESAWVHGRRYGTPASSVLEPLASGCNLVINVDVQGVDNFRRAAAANPLLQRHLTTVFIRVPLDELRRRMVARAQDGDEEIEKRLRNAQAELLEASKFDHCIESTTREEDFHALVRIFRSARDRLAVTRG